MEAWCSWFSWMGPNQNEWFGCGMERKIVMFRNEVPERNSDGHEALTKSECRMMITQIWGTITMRVGLAEYPSVVFTGWWMRRMQGVGTHWLEVLRNPRKLWSSIKYSSWIDGHIFRVFGNTKTAHFNKLPIISHSHVRKGQTGCLKTIRKVLNTGIDPFRNEVWYMEYEVPSMHLLT